MPPKEKDTKKLQKKSSETKQDKEMVVVEDDRHSLVDKQKDSVSSAQSLVAEPQPDVDEPPKLKSVKSFVKKKDDVLEQAIADVELDNLSFSEEYCEEEHSESEESDKMFGIIEPISRFMMFDISALEEEDEEADKEEKKNVPTNVHQDEIADEENFFPALDVIPDEDQISMDEAVDLEVTQSVVYYPDKESVTTATGDRGQFVNPLTGQMSVEQSTDEQEKQKKNK